MTRPLRIEFPGEVHHVTLRHAAIGNRREPIFESDDDRALLLGIVGQIMKRFDAVMLAYCFRPRASACSQQLCRGGPVGRTSQPVDQEA